MNCPICHKICLRNNAKESCKPCAEHDYHLSFFYFYVKKNGGINSWIRSKDHLDAYLHVTANDTSYLICWAIDNKVFNFEYSDLQGSLEERYIAVYGDFLKFQKFNNFI